MFQFLWYWAVWLWCLLNVILLYKFLRNKLKYSSMTFVSIKSLFDHICCIVCVVFYLGGMLEIMNLNLSIHQPEVQSLKSCHSFFVLVLYSYYSYQDYQIIMEINCTDSLLVQMNHFLRKYKYNNEE